MPVRWKQGSGGHAQPGMVGTVPHMIPPEIHPDPPPSGPTYRVFDRFNRPDGPLGNAETGQPWVIRMGVDATGIVDGMMELHGANAFIEAVGTDLDIQITVVSLAPGDGLHLYFHDTPDDAPNALALYDVGYYELTFQANGDYVTYAGQMDDPFASGSVRLVVSSSHATLTVNGVGVVDTDIALTGGEPYVPAGEAIGIGDLASGPNRFDDVAVPAA
jgi:hypothetical protein